MVNKTSTVRMLTHIKEILRISAALYIKVNLCHVHYTRV